MPSSGPEYEVTGVPDSPQACYSVMEMYCWKSAYEIYDSFVQDILESPGGEDISDRYFRKKASHHREEIEKMDRFIELALEGDYDPGELYEPDNSYMAGLFRSRDRFRGSVSGFKDEMWKLEEKVSPEEALNAIFLERLIMNIWKDP